MNMFWRILIVIGNVVLFPIAFPIVTTVVLVYSITHKLPVKFMMECYMEGVIQSVNSNFEFIKTGDLNVFLNKH